MREDAGTLLMEVVLAGIGKSSVLTQSLSLWSSGPALPFQSYLLSSIYISANLQSLSFHEK